MYLRILLTHLLFPFPCSPLIMRASSSSWPLTWRMTSQKSCVSTSSPPSKARQEAALLIRLEQGRAYWVGCLYLCASFNTTDQIIHKIRIRDFSCKCISGQAGRSGKKSTGVYSCFIHADLLEIIQISINVLI